MDIGTSVSILGGLVSVMWTADKWFSRNARTEVSASRGEKAAESTTALDKQTALLEQRFDNQANQFDILSKQLETLGARDKEISQQGHQNAATLHDHENRILSAEKSQEKLERLVSESLTQLSVAIATSGSQMATAISTNGQVLSRLTDLTELSIRLSKVEGRVDDLDPRDGRASSTPPVRPRR